MTPRSTLDAKSVWHIIIWTALIMIQECYSLASPESSINSQSIGNRKGYRVCTSSPCSTNGSELLLEALQQLATPDTTIKEVVCLGGCCSGTVIRSFGLNARRRTLPIISDEKIALDTAKSLLQDINGLDNNQWNLLETKMAAGERALENIQDPEICQNCGVGLQLYRGNCAKCGKYPY